MRSNNVLLVIVLFAVSFSNAFEFTNLAEVRALRASSYGNSLIETISLTLQNNGSIDEIQKLLNDLLFKLNQDQQTADTEWKKAKTELDAHIEDLSGRINSTNAQIALDTAEKQKNADLSAKAKVNLDQYNSQLVSNDAALQKNEDNRKKDEEEYKKSVQDHNDVINAVDAVISELSKLEGSVSGVNRPDSITDLTDAEKRDAAWMAAHPKSKAQVNAQAGNSAHVNAQAQVQASFVQLTKDETEAMIFAQLATKADQEALQKLISLLNGLADKTKESLNEDQEKEDASKKTYQRLKAALTADNANLNKNIDEETKNKATYDDNVKKLGVKINGEQALVVSMTAEMKATIAERDAKEKQYLADKAERDNERVVIKRLQEIVKQRLANMSKFLRAQTGGF